MPVLDPDQGARRRAIDTLAGELCLADVVAKTVANAVPEKVGIVIARQQRQAVILSAAHEPPKRIEDWPVRAVNGVELFYD